MAHESYTRCLLVLMHIMRRSVSAWNDTTLLVIFAGSLLLLISSVSRGQRLRSSEGRTTALAGLFGLVYSGLDFVRYFGDGIPPFSSAETILYFAWALVGGVSLAMFFVVILSQKSAKVIIVISCVLFVAFNLIVFARYAQSNRTPTVRIFLCGFGWFIGMAITSAVVLWLEHRRDAGTAKPEELV